MIDLHDYLYGEPHLNNYSLEDIHFDGRGDEDDPETWTFVRARVQERGVMLYSEGIYRVVRTRSETPLTDAADEIETTDDVKDHMPRGPRRQRAVPSIQGDYISVQEVYGNDKSKRDDYSPDDDDEGPVVLDKHMDSRLIPVEFVIEPLTYDEAVNHIIDDHL